MFREEALPAGVRLGKQRRFLPVAALSLVGFRIAVRSMSGAGFFAAVFECSVRPASAVSGEASAVLYSAPNAGRVCVIVCCATGGACFHA